MDLEKGRQDLQRMISKCEETAEGRLKLQNWINHFNNPNIGKRTGKLVPFTTNLDELFPSSDSSDNEDLDTPLAANQPSKLPAPAALPEPDFIPSAESTPNVAANISTSTMPLALEGTKDGSFTTNLINSVAGSQQNVSPLVKTKILKKRLFTNTGTAPRQKTKSHLNNTEKEHVNHGTDPSVEMTEEKEKDDVADKTANYPQKSLARSASRKKSRTQNKSRNTSTKQKPKVVDEITLENPTQESHSQIETSKSSNTLLKTTSELQNRTDKGTRTTVTDEDTTNHNNHLPSNVENSVSKSDESDIEDFVDEQFVVESISKAESTRIRNHLLGASKRKSTPPKKKKTRNHNETTTQERQASTEPVLTPENSGGGKRKRGRPKKIPDQTLSPPDNRNSPTPISMSQPSEVSPIETSQNVKEVTLETGSDDAEKYTVEPMTSQEKDTIRKLGSLISRNSTLGAEVFGDSSSTTVKRKSRTKKKTQVSKLQDNGTASDDSEKPMSWLQTASQRKSRKQRLISDDEDHDDVITETAENRNTVTNQEQSTNTVVLSPKDQKNLRKSNNLIKPPTEKPMKSVQNGRKSTKKGNKRHAGNEKSLDVQQTTVSPEKKPRLRSRSADKTATDVAASIPEENSVRSLHNWLSTTSTEPSNVATSRISMDKLGISKPNASKTAKGKSKQATSKRKTQSKEADSDIPKVVTPTSKFNPFKEPIVNDNNLIASGPIKQRTTYGTRHVNPSHDELPSHDDMDHDDEHIAFPLVDQSSIMNLHSSNRINKSHFMGPPASTPRHVRRKNKVVTHDSPSPAHDAMEEEDISVNSDDTYADNQELDTYHDDDGSPTAEISRTSNHQETNLPTGKSKRSKKAKEKDKIEESKEKEKREKPSKLKKSRRMETSFEKEQVVNKSKSKGISRSRKSTKSNDNKKMQRKFANQLFYNVVPTELVKPADDATPGVRRSSRVRTKPLHRWLGEDYQYDEAGNIVGVQSFDTSILGSTAVKHEKSSDQQRNKNVPKMPKSRRTKSVKPQTVSENHFTEKDNNTMENTVIEAANSQHVTSGIESVANTTMVTEQTHDYSNANKEEVQKKKRVRKSRKNQNNVEAESQNSQDKKNLIKRKVTVETADVENETGFSEDKNQAMEDNGSETSKVKLTTGNELNTTTYSVIDQTRVVEVGANKLISIPDNETTFEDPVEGDKLTYTKGLTNKAVAMGTVRIPPGQQKGLSCMHHMLCFHLIRGVVEVLLCDKWSILAEGSYFIVPSGNGYNIRNTNAAKEAVLVFTQVKIKSQGMVFQ